MQAAHEAAGLRARLKELEGGRLTTREQKALERWQREFESEHREKWLRRIPKGMYCDLAGRAQNVVRDFGERYQIPVEGAEVDLAAVVSALHTRVSELAAAARPNLDADEAELVREKLRQEIGKLQRQSATLQIELDKHMEKLLAKTDVAAGLDWLSSRLRALGSHLYRAVGTPGVDAVNEFLDQLTAELEDGGALHF